MRRLVRIGLTGLIVHLIGHAAIAPARAAGGPEPAAAVTQKPDFAARLGDAYTLVEDGEPARAIQQLDPLIAELEEADDPDTLLLAFDVLGYAGARQKDRNADLRGNGHSVMLNYLKGPLNSPETMVAEFTLAQSFARNDLPEGRFYALVNVLAAVEGARRAGPLSDDMEETEAMATALLGQMLWNEGRPEAALPLLRRSAVLAHKGRIDADNAAKLDIIVREAEAQAALPPTEPLPGADDCRGGPALDAAKMTLCRQAADRATAQGDELLAERILSNVLADVPEGSMRAERYAAGRDLFMLRMLNRPATDPATLASADLVGNYLASIVDLTSATLVGMRAARAVVDSGVANRRIAELCGHIARRAVRFGSEDVARRLLAMERQVTLAGLAPTDRPFAALPQDERVPRVTAALLGLEIAQIASTDHPRLAAAERDAVERLIAGIDLADFTAIEDITTVEYAERKVYVYPTYAAAVDFVGRLARRLPRDDPRYDQIRIGWISAIEVWWGDTARADALAEDAIREIRAAPEGRQSALSVLLTLRAEMAEPTNPALTARFTREAYEALSNLPDHASERVELLMDMASDQSDTALSRALIAEAQKVRQAAGPGVSIRMQARLDMKRAFIAFDDGDRDGALKLAEGAIAALVADGKKDSWMIRDPAGSLGDLYAALGRMDDARRTYETYVFPQSDPTLVGEEKALDDQLSLANLEAYYAPDDGTLKTLASLLARARTRVKGDRTLERRILRAQAFAYHGTGDGPKAITTAREALQTARSPATDTTSAREDRKLLETLVGAAWLGSHPMKTP